MQRVGIVILNYKNWQDTIECLESLTRVKYDNCEIIVVDNDSQNDSLLRIHQWLSERSMKHASITEDDIGETSSQLAENVILVQSFRNRGYSGGNNLGIRIALNRHADYVLILNSDTVVQNDFLRPLLQYAESHEEIGVVGPKVVDEEGKIDRTCARRRPRLPLQYFFIWGIGEKLFPNNRWIRYHYYLGEYSFDHPREVDVISGSCMLIKRVVFEECGLLDENVFLLEEEVILHERLRAVQMSSAVVPASQIVHKRGKSRKQCDSAFIQKTLQRSTYYYLTEVRGYSRLAASLMMPRLRQVLGPIWRRLKGSRKK
jgi:hypothetical protein